MKYCIALAGLTGIIYGATLTWWEAGLIIVAILVVVGLSARDSRRRLGPKPTGPCGPPRPPAGVTLLRPRPHDWETEMDRAYQMCARTRCYGVCTPQTGCKIVAGARERLQ